MCKKNLLATVILIIMCAFSFLPVKAVTEETQTVQTQQTKSEIKHVLKKFAFAMALVGGSCLILYFALRTYKRFKEQEILDDTSSYVDVTKNLTTPDTIEDATKFFIEKF